MLFITLGNGFLHGFIMSVDLFGNMGWPEAFAGYLVVMDC
jgi:hypothetical protein